jgi:hypothetical protein
MIKFLDVGYLINCRHKIKQEDKLVVTSCVLKVIRRKIEKELHIFLEKSEIKKILSKNITQFGAVKGGGEARRN